MPTSQARIEANRRNAARSTGPKTRQGKDRSRANSLKHGLTAEVLRTVEEIASIGEPADRSPGKLGSSPLDREWINNEIKLLSLRIERAGLMEMRLRDRSANRASIWWDQDQRSEAEVIGAQISRKPAETVIALERTPQGCQWLIERWAMLARVADAEGDWSPEIRSLAYDLLGTAPSLRSGSISEKIDDQGQVLDHCANLGDFARKVIASLVDSLETIEELDAFDRETAESGLAIDLGPAAQRLFRYEAALQRRLQWYHDLLDRLPETPSTTTTTSDVPTVEPARIETPRDRENTAVLVSNKFEFPIGQPMPSRQSRKAERVERRRLAAERKLSRRLE